MKRREDLGRVERQIGRLLQRNSRAAERYKIEVKEDESLACGLSFSWSIRPEWEEWAGRTEGCYILRTNISDWTPEELWQTYVQLSQAEDAFRTQKTQLSIRPISHQKKERVQAHILVCFLEPCLGVRVNSKRSVGCSTRGGAIGSPSNGCPNMRPSSTISSPSDAISKPDHLANQTFTDAAALKADQRAQFALLAQYRDVKI